MRLFAACLFVLLVLIQYPLWFGRGGKLHVKALEQQVQEVNDKNIELMERNVKLASEVQDLKAGKEAVEERARFDLGMIKPDEIFVQILNPNTPIQVDNSLFVKTKPDKAGDKKATADKQPVAND